MKGLFKNKDSLCIKRIWYIREKRRGGLQNDRGVSIAESADGNRQ